MAKMANIGFFEGFNRFAKELSPEGTGDFGDLGKLLRSGELDTSKPGDTQLQQFEFLGANEGRTFSDRFGGTIDSVFDASNRVGQEENVAEARDRAGRSTAVSEGAFERSTRGADLSPRQKAAARKRFSLRGALARTNAANVARRGIGERGRLADQFGAGLEGTLFAQETAGLSGLAEAEMANTLKNKGKAAKKRSDKRNAMAQVGGMIIGMSSETFKDKRGPAEKLLDRLKKIRVDKWNYKGDDSEHIGPYAEEFNDTFGTDGAAGDKRFINLVDGLGVALGAIKELNEKVEGSHG